MIVPHLILKSMFEEFMPEIKGVHYGNVSELKNYMNIKANENIYPLAWIELPYQSDTSSLDGKFREVPVRLFFATTTRKEWLNDKREIETFLKTLRPIYDDFVNQSRLENRYNIVGREIEAIEAPDFHTSSFETKDRANKVNAYWDVITVRFTARFNTNCVGRKTLRPQLRVILINGRALLIGNRAIILNR